jgi:hypothetical protein
MIEHSAIVCVRILHLVETVQAKRAATRQLLGLKRKPSAQYAAHLLPHQAAEIFIPEVWLDSCVAY